MIDAIGHFCEMMGMIQQLGSVVGKINCLRRNGGQGLRNLGRKLSMLLWQLEWTSVMGRVNGKFVIVWFCVHGCARE